MLLQIKGSKGGVDRGLARRFPQIGIPGHEGKGGNQDPEGTILPFLNGFLQQERAKGGRGWGFLQGVFVEVKPPCPGKHGAGSTAHQPLERLFKSAH